MASWKRSQGQKVPDTGYTRAKALGRNQLGVFKDLEKVRQAGAGEEAARELLRLAAPRPGRPWDAGRSVDCWSQGHREATAGF